MDISESHVVIPLRLFEKMAEAYYGQRGPSQVAHENEADRGGVVESVPPTIRDIELPRKRVPIIPGRKLAEQQAQLSRSEDGQQDDRPAEG